MIKFVNAKLNLGLDIVRKREDGYHDLETIFYPLGIHNGTPENPEPFCDILEITPASETEFIFKGRKVDCPLEKNLVYKAWKIFNYEFEAKSGTSLPAFRIRLEKNLPDGAGLGGGSADASFTLTMLNDLTGTLFSDCDIEAMALKLGADCPFFIKNRPCFAQGVGERLTPVDIDLSGWWCVLVKPDISISTKEAFTGVVPAKPVESLTKIIELPVSEWQGRMKNDFESSLFPAHQELADLKMRMIGAGAEYAAMSGSGSTIFGLFTSEMRANEAIIQFNKDAGVNTYLCML